MKKIVLSTLAALTLGSVVANASALKLYQDENGQVFTSPAEGRTLIKTSDTPTYAKASKLKFSGVHYIGLTSKDLKDGDRTTNFEVRRNYLQVKAYLLEDPKSYFRVTLDTSYDAKHDGHADIYAKYMYLYLNDVLPSTGVEIGMAHRPWIDYEEHQSWLTRSVSKVFAESSEAGHLTNSADLGVNFKTKTPYFTSEVGLFNGEGYHGENEYDDDDNVTASIGKGLSTEWRFTAALLGNGKVHRKATKDTYFDASFYGQYNVENAKNDGKTYKIYGLHTVYNTPVYLVSGQYVVADSNQEDTTDFNGKGFSINGEYRFGEEKEFSLVGRYDYWKNENTTTSATSEEKNYIYGAAYQQNKNVKWLVTGQTYYVVGTDDEKDYNSLMVTTEVHW